MTDYKCELSYVAAYKVCGTDLKTYDDFDLCPMQHTEYGKRVNLQLKHDHACSIWEEYGFETYTVLFVSKIDPILIKAAHIFTFCSNFVLFVLLLLFLVRLCIRRAKGAPMKRDKPSSIIMSA